MERRQAAAAATALVLRLNIIYGTPRSPFTACLLIDLCSRNDQSLHQSLIFYRSYTEVNIYRYRYVKYRVSIAIFIFCRYHHLLL